MAREEKTKQNTDYGYDIQKVYLEVMLTDAETFVRCQSVFDPKSFDKRLQPAAEFLQKYVAEYSNMPTFDMVNAVGKSDLKDPGQMQDAHYDWLMNEFEVFARHKALEAAILKSADLLEKGDVVMQLDAELQVSKKTFLRGANPISHLGFSTEM